MGKAQDSFVAADTFSYIFRSGGKSTRVGNRNLLTLPRYRHRENVRMLLRRHTTDFHIFNQVFRSQEYEPILALFGQMERSGPVRIVDAGSNVGCSPIWWLCCFPGAEVVAIEPDANNFNLMEENVSLNHAGKSVVALRRALWSSAEKLHISQDFRDGREYAFSVSPAASSAPQDAVDGITLPEILASREWSGIDILKVDVEGAERYLFEEMQQAEINLRGVSILALEIHDEVADRQKIEINLRRLGFELSHHHETVFARRTCRQNPSLAGELAA
jgi:FkbM family methyltransferase